MHSVGSVEKPSNFFIMGLQIDVQPKSTIKLLVAVALEHQFEHMNMITDLIVSASRAPIRATIWKYQNCVWTEALRLYWIIYLQHSKLPFRLSGGGEKTYPESYIRVK